MFHKFIFTVCFISRFIWLNKEVQKTTDIYSDTLYVLSLCWNRMLCVTGVATMYGRYKFIEQLNQRTGGVGPVVNKIAFGFGLLSCLGMCVVATFQVRC